MTNKAKLKPGEWWIVAGMVATLGGGIFLPIILFDHMPAYSVLKQEGMVVDGVIRAKESEQSTSSRRKRNNASENFYFVIAFNSNSGVPFGQSQAAEKPAKPAMKSGADLVASLNIGGGSSPFAAGPTDTQVRLNAGSFDNFERYSTGSAISVTFLPNDPKTAKLTDMVRAYNPWPQMMIAASLLIGGVVALWQGFRRRRQYVTSSGVEFP